MSDTGPIVGIDLGTTNSVVAIYRDGRAEVIPNALGFRTTPSVVAFKDTDGEVERLVGDAAKQQGIREPANCILSAKRFIGRRMKDPAAIMDAKKQPYKVKEGSKKEVLFEVAPGGKAMDVTPEEIAASVLRRCKEDAEALLGEAVNRAVITVPAYFSDAQRQATRDAGKIAGLQVVRIINEPTAAAIAYGLDKSQTALAAEAARTSGAAATGSAGAGSAASAGSGSGSGSGAGASGTSKGDEDDGSRTIVVFDYGGGTLDVTVLNIEGTTIEVLATKGNMNLGGDDVNMRLVDYCANLFSEKHGVDVRSNARAMHRLLKACEAAKVELSSALSTHVYVDSLAGGEDLDIEVRRPVFDSLCDDMFKEAMEPVIAALADAKVDKSDVDEVVLAGGSSRIPKMRALLKDFFGGKELNTSINADEAVARGACIQAAVIQGKGMLDSTMLMPLVLLDVTPLKKSLELADGSASVLIERNTPLPARNTLPYTTAYDNQTQVTIKVCEGERKVAEDNLQLGAFKLDGIPAMPKGKAEIDITFDIDIDGVLKVSAVEKKGGSKGGITIDQDKGRLSTADIERMVGEAEKYKERDEAKLQRMRDEIAREEAAQAAAAAEAAAKGAAGEGKSSGAP